MKVVFIIHALNIGGMERVMSILLNNFAQRNNVEVSLVLIGRHRRIEFDLDQRIQVYKPGFKFNPRQRNLSTLKTLSFIRQTIQSIKPSVILSFGEMWNNLVLLSLSGLNFPIYISDRSQPDKNLGRLHNFLKKKFYPKANGLIAQTTHAANIAKRKKLNNNIKVIGNPIRALDLPKVKRENIILTVGRLIPTKNVDRLIDVFSNLDDKHWELIVIGGNAKHLDLLSQYKTQVKTLGMTEQIKLLGQQKHVEDHFAKSQIFAFMSTSEGFPNALGEAMAAGCACIAYDCVAGPSDMIDDGINGFLIPEGNETLFQQRLSELIQNQDIRERLGTKAQEKIKNFEAHKISQSFLDFMLQQRPWSYTE